jgi:transposase
MFQATHILDVWTRCMDEIKDQEEIRIYEAPESSGKECELCGTEMFGLHCKLICPNCGYRRDCSDP